MSTTSFLRALVLAVALAGTLPTAAASQDSSSCTCGMARAAVSAPPPAPDTTRLRADTLALAGHRVRGTLTTGSSFTGTVQAVHGDTLIMRERGVVGPHVVSAGSLSTLEVERPNRHLTRNVQIGGVLGAIAATAVYMNQCDKHPDTCRTQRQDDDDYYHDDDVPEWDLGAAMLIGGMVVGGAIGYVLTPPSWRRVGVAVSADVRPATGGSASATLGARVPLAVLDRRSARR